MANHGDRAGPPLLPRVHVPIPGRARAPVPPPRPPPVLHPYPASATLAPAPIPAPVTTQPTTEVSLQAPRPDVERVVNEYVETPLRAGTVPTPAVPSLPVTRHRPGEPHRHSVTLPVRQQPTAFKKEPVIPRSVQSSPLGAVTNPSNPASMPIAAGLDDSRTSIICPACGRCRCDACQEPRALPSRWLCGDSCLCSAETAVDYASCLCCVKGLLYHCSDGESDRLSYADDPCSCSGPGSLARWCCLGAATTLLPCLLCYWPLRALLRVCEACYSRCTRSGCRCRPPLTSATGPAGAGGNMPSTTPAGSPASSHHGLLTPDKRLLDCD